MSTIPRDVISLDQFGRAMAHLAHFAKEERPRVLGKLGISADLWEASEKYWLEALRGDADDPAAPVALAFASPFGEQQTALGEQQPALDDVTPIVAVTSPGDAFAPADETAFALPAVDADSTLPFTDGASAPPVPSITDSDLAGLPHPDAGGTAMFAAVADASLPFPTSKPRETPEALRARFTLTYWASLSAELVARKGARESVLGAYQLDEAAYALLRRAWDEHFAGAPSERAEYERLVATYFAALTPGRKA